MEGKIANLVTEKLELEPEHFEGCFVYGVAIKARAQAGDKIDVFIDGDNGVNITQCARVNRYLQHIFDETPQKWFGERYTLDVSSPGIGQPIKFRRQYQIGRAHV